PRSCPLATWRDAFVPDSLVGVGDLNGNGGWHPWIEALPPNEALPGDPVSGRSLSIESYMGQSAALIRTLLRGMVGGDDAAGSSNVLGADVVGDGIARLLRTGGLATLAGLSQGARLVEALVRKPDVQ